MSVYGSVLMIEEVGVVGRGARSLFLSGNGLPHQGASWKSAQRVPTTWYPGNRRATQQLLVVMEVPSTWEGEWKRTLLPKSGCVFVDSDGSTSTIIAPQQLRDAFEAMLSEGALLRVTWRSSGADAWDNDSVVREGRATSWEFPTTRAHDIGWNVEFTWVGRGDQPPSPFSTRDADYAKRLTALQASSEAFAQSFAAATAVQTIATNAAKRAASIATPNALTLGRLEALAGYPQQLMRAASRQVLQVTTQMRQLADIATLIATTPAQVSSSAVTMARNVARAADDFVDSMGRVPAELQTTKQRPSDLAIAARYFAGTVDAANQVVADAAALANAIRAFLAERAPLQAKTSSASTQGQQQDGVLAVRVARDGDTFVGLSVEFYGDPDHAADIARANRLPWYTAAPTVGRPVVIPALSTGRPTGA